MRLALDFCCTPTPLRLHNADNGLAALVDGDVLDLDRLLARAAVLFQRFNLRRECTCELVDRQQGGIAVLDVLCQS